MFLFSSAFKIWKQKSGTANKNNHSHIELVFLLLAHMHTCTQAHTHTHKHNCKQRKNRSNNPNTWQQPKHPTTKIIIHILNLQSCYTHTHTRRCLYSNPANCEGPSESHVSLKTYSLVPWSKSVNAITRNPSCHNHVPRSFFSCSPILFLAASTESTHTSTWSPSPKFWPGTRGGRILLTWISPFWPTPMSTKAPKWVTFVTLPVSRVPGLRSEMDVIPFLNSGFWKSAQEW